MSDNARRWAIIATAFAVGVAIAAGGTYLYMTSQVQAQKAEQAKAEAALADALERQAALEESAAAQTPETPPVAQEPTEVPKAEDPAKPVTTRQLAFITKVVQGASPSLSADYANFLTGDEAAAAAAERGDESPPPNDYYIVNDNRKLRTLKVAPRVKVQLVSNADGTSDPSGYTADFETWANHFAAPSDENAAIRQAPYWLTLKGGVVVAIEEQFLP